MSKPMSKRGTMETRGRKVSVEVHEDGTFTAEPIAESEDIKVEEQLVPVDINEIFARTQKYAEVLQQEARNIVKIRDGLIDIYEPMKTHSDIAEEPIKRIFYMELLPIHVRIEDAWVGVGELFERVCKEYPDLIPKPEAEEE